MCELSGVQLDGRTERNFEVTYTFPINSITQKSGKLRIVTDATVMFITETVKEIDFNIRIL